MDEQLRRPTPAPVANCRSGCSAANATFSMARAVRGRRKTGTSINAVVAGGGMPCACDSRRAMTTTKIADWLQPKGECKTRAFVRGGGGTGLIRLYAQGRPCTKFQEDKNGG